MRAEGLDVACVDANARLFAVAGSDPDVAALWHDSKQLEWSGADLERTLARFGSAIDDLLAEIAAHAPRVVGFTVYQENLRTSMEIARRLRRACPDAAVVMGGPWFPGTIAESAIDTDAVDAFVIGEGEITAPRIVALGVEEGRDGLRRRMNGSPIVVADPPLDLDAVPLADYAGLDLSLYEPDHVSVLTTRGCPFRCRFCMDHGAMGAHRMKSVPKVLDELELVVNRLGRSYVMFNDLLVNAKPQRLEDLCRGIVDRGIEFTWVGNAVIRRSLTPEALRLVRESGCTLLLFGMESASDPVLKAMNKPFRRDLAARVIRDVHDAGIECRVNLVVGFPGEGEAEFVDTLDFLRARADSIDSVGFLSPFQLLRETPIWHRRAEYGLLPDGAIEEFWETEDGNTPEVRLDRAERALARCREVGIHVEKPHIETYRINWLAKRDRFRRETILRTGDVELDVFAGRAEFRFLGRTMCAWTADDVEIELDGESLPADPARWERTKKRRDRRLSCEIARLGADARLSFEFELPEFEPLTWSLVLTAEREIDLSGLVVRLLLNRNYGVLRAGGLDLPVPAPSLEEAEGGACETVAEGATPLFVGWTTASGLRIPGLMAEVRSESREFRATIRSGRRLELELRSDERAAVGSETVELLRANLAPWGRFPAVRKAASGPLVVAIEEGAVALSVGGALVTAQAGLLLDLDVPGVGRLASTAAAWESVWRTDDDAVVDATCSWEAGRPLVSQRFHVDADGLVWSAYLLTEAAIELDRVKVGIVLDERYGTWRTGDASGRFDGAGDGAWRVVGPVDGSGRMPLAEGYTGTGPATIDADGDAVRRLRVDCMDAIAPLSPIAQANCAPGVYVGFYRTGRLRVDRGRSLLCRLRIDVTV